MSKMGREGLRNVRDGSASSRFGTYWLTFPEVRDGWEGPQEGPGLVGRSTQRSRKGWKTFQEVRDGSRVPAKVPGWVGEPSWMSGMGWKVLRKAQVRSRGLSKGLGWVVRLSRRYETGQGTLPRSGTGRETL